jgi:hypothetical protein
MQQQQQQPGEVAEQPALLTVSTLEGGGTADEVGAVGSGAPSGAYIAAAREEVEGEGTVTGMDDWESVEGDCEICFDEKACVELWRCGHTLCVTCTREMCKLHHFKPALCPFCRQIIMELRLFD